MKNIYYGLAIMCSLSVLPSCTNELEDQISSSVVDSDEITINVGMPTHTSRVLFDDTNLDLSWEKGDKLTFVGYDAEGKYLDQSDFTLSAGEGSMSGQFSGKLIEGATQYIIYYKTKGLFVNYTNGTAQFTYGSSIQEGNNSSHHIKNNLYLCSEMINASTIMSEGVALKMMNSLVRIDLKNLPNDLNVNSLVWLNNGGTDQMNSCSVSFRNLVKGDISAYISFDPAEMNLLRGGKFEVQVFGDTKVYYNNVTSVNGKNYKAGSRAVASFSSNWKEAEKPDGQIWVMSNNNEDLSKCGLSCSPKKNDFGYYSISKEDHTELTEIPDEFFNMNWNISRVILPSSILRIGEKAFASSNMESILMSDQLVTIEDRAFMSCTNLSSVDFPFGVTKIGTNAFYTCRALTKVDLSATKVKELPLKAFGTCVELRSVKLPESLEILGTQSFSGCKNLPSIEIPQGVKELKNGVFSFCDNLRKVVVRSKQLNFKVDEFCSIFQGIPTDAELFLNVQLKNQVKGGRTWAGNKWKSITFIDEDGNPVKE